MRPGPRTRTILLWGVVALGILVAVVRFARLWLRLGGHAHLG